MFIKCRLYVSVGLMMTFYEKQIIGASALRECRFNGEINIVLIEKIVGST